MSKSDTKVIKTILQNIVNNPNEKKYRFVNIKSNFYKTEGCCVDK